MADDDPVLENLAEVLGVDRERINNTTVATDIEEWDSMGMMSILIMLDRLYEVKLPPNQTNRLQSVAGIKEILREAGKLI